MRPGDDIRLLQFGGGNFLRAFVDLFLHEANGAGDGDAHGRALVVTSTGAGRAAALRAAAGRYHVLLRGLADGARVDDTVHVTRAVRAAVAADAAWEQVLATAAAPPLRWVVSNTTEAGFALDPADDGPEVRDAALDASPSARAPRSFPAKLLAVLVHRRRQGGAPVAVLPCELVEGNGGVLRALLRRQADAWDLPADDRDWVETACAPADTLVDRIVSGRPATHPLRAEDPLLTVAEPFACWVVERRPGEPLFPHPAVETVDDVAPFSLRKVRVLNGAHTALVCRARPLGLQTVADAVAHPEVGPWLRDLLFEEILPVLEGRVAGGPAFAEATLERFANPFLQHRLDDIALHHETKVGTRLLPTWREHRERFGRPAPRLEELLRPYR